jgi:hypothetical protein
MTIRSQFQQHIYTTAEQQGFVAPQALLDYLVDLLADRLRDTDIIPQPSFAERWMQINQRPRLGDLQEFGDQCLFFCSLMPRYGLRRGLTLDYYATLGVSAYYTVGDMSGDVRYTQLGNWFYHLQKFLDSALHPDQAMELVRIH